MSEPDPDVILRRLGMVPGSGTEDLRSLIAYVIELGGTEDEIVAAARRGHLGPLALDLGLRPPGPTLSLDSYAAQAGVDPGLVHRIWRAFGLPDSDELPAPVTPDAGQAIDVLRFLIDSLGEDAALGFARVVGASVTQISDALANVMRVGVEVPKRSTGVPYSEVAREYTTAGRDLLPVLWDAIGAVFRRHLVVASNQNWDIDEAGVAVTQQRTLGFVDLVGSTDVLRGVSPAELARLVDRFEQLVWDRVTAAGGRVVKLIGDEAMFALDDPVDGCRLALDLVAASSQPVRVGMAHGAVVAFHGDYYGPTVNLAARLVGAAGPSSVVVSASMAAAASEDLRFEAISPGPLRGFPEVTTAYRVERAGGGEAMR